MKNTVKIASIEANNEFENANGIKQHTLHVLIHQPIITGRFVSKDDNNDSEREKVMKMSDQVTMSYKDFLKVVSLDDNLGQLDPSQSKAEDWKVKIDETYHQHFSLLRGANITINREEVRSPVYELDENGDVRLDDDGNPIAKKDGDEIVTKIVGFGATTYSGLELTPRAKERLTKLIEKQDE